MNGLSIRLAEKSNRIILGSNVMMTLAITVKCSKSSHIAMFQTSQTVEEWRQKERTTKSSNL
eukprot:snap_masked-scaffold_13-processed-gene-7.16-mRNA-1 protein AED:1.00 eAED:1.00 QI:0/0/0/0/1/1/2/0/61